MTAALPIVRQTPDLRQLAAAGFETGQEGIPTCSNTCNYTVGGRMVPPDLRPLIHSILGFADTGLPFLDRVAGISMATGGSW